MQKVLLLQMRDEKGLMVIPFGTTMTNYVPRPNEKRYEILGFIQNRQ